MVDELDSGIVDVFKGLPESDDLDEDTITYVQELSTSVLGDAVSNKHKRDATKEELHESIAPLIEAALDEDAVDEFLEKLLDVAFPKGKDDGKSNGNGGLKKNLANKIFGYLARCEAKFWYIDPKN